MVIKDILGQYELRVDLDRKIVYEVFKGLWSTETFTRYDLDIKNRVIPYLGSSRWVKLSDMRQYIPNVHVTPEMMMIHLRDIVPHGFDGGGVIVESTTLKMQLFRAGRGSIEPEYFHNLEEGEDWLRSQGY